MEGAIQLDKYLANLTTEEVNQQTVHIDTCSTLEMVTLINEQDQLVALAVQEVLPEIAKAVEILYEHLSTGGKMCYLGAGTSGRLGVLDASECPPTYGTASDLVQAYIAGGDKALRVSSEGCEDNGALGIQQVLDANITKKDVVIGITASGSATYVIEALKKARELGASTIGVVNNKNTKLEAYCDVCIAPIVGPEVISGSTRMKSGTAQKMVLNMLSTGAMIKLGKVYGNRMVDLKATNKKLVDRAVRMIVSLTGVMEEEAKEVLELAHNDTKLAIFMLKTTLSYEEAKQKLKEHQGILTKALKSV